MKSQQELWMSQRDRDRLKVLHEAEKGHVTQKQAGEQLKLSERWVRTLVARLRKEGDGGILHRLRGRASKRKIAEAVRNKAVRWVKREYGDFGPTLAAAYLGRERGLEVRSTTRPRRTCACWGRTWSAGGDRWTSTRTSTACSR